MKKVFLILGIIVTVSLNCANASIYEAPNAGNLNFYPMMQRQREQQETLDFKDMETYRKDREKKDNENKIRETKFNPNYSPNYGGAFLHPVHPVQMQFTKGADGNIKIQGIHTNSTTLINTDKKDND